MVCYYAGTDRRNILQLRSYQGEHNVDIMDHEVGYHINVCGSLYEFAQPMHLYKTWPIQLFVESDNSGIESFEVPYLEYRTALLGFIYY